MKSTCYLSLVATLPLASLAVAQTPVGTAFTYQGRLNEAGAPANGAFVMTFALFDDAGGNNQVGPTVVFDGLGGNPTLIDVTGGLFTVPLDFGAGVFEGNTRWLEITVEGTPLSPRQQVTPTPYAVHADQAAGLVLPLDADVSHPGVGLRIDNSHPTTAVGIEGVANNNNDNAAGVIGRSIGGSARINGVWGTSTSTRGTGVRGEATAASGDTKGIWGKTTSPDGFGGYFEGMGYFSGNVGIGTTSPQTSLTVNNGGVSVFDDAGQGIHLTTNSFTLSNADNEDPVYRYQHPSDRHTFYTQGSQRLTITTDGNVGIGTTSPQSLLHVGGAYSPSVGGSIARFDGTVAVDGTILSDEGSLLSRAPGGGPATAALTLDASAATGGNSWQLLSHADVNPYAAPGGSFTIYQIESGEHRLILDPSGRVGIGTVPAASGAQLQVEAVSELDNGIFGRGSIGVAGNSGHANGIGVYGIAQSGVVGQSTQTDGEGVWGSSSGPGATYGGFFNTSSTTGVGVYGMNSSNGGFAYGVFGELTNPSATGAAVKGKAPYLGVLGEATDSGTGVIGRSSAPSGNGVYGESSSNVGVLGAATAATGTTYGVRGISNSAAGYGGYFEGRGYFSGDVGIGVAPTTNRLDVRDSSTSANILNVQRESDAASGSDMVQIVKGAASSDMSQFIECERGADVKFRVWGDGDVTADGTYTSPADFAEMIRVSSGAESVEPGDVVAIDVNNPRAVVKSATARSRLVAGVYSTKPGVLGSEHDWDDVARELGLDPTSDTTTESLKPIDLGKRINEVPVAVIGIVPCKVSAENGAIRPGDLLVTSNTAGHAMRDENPRAGTIVGKSLGSLDSGTGVIRVLVTLQ